MRSNMTVVDCGCQVIHLADDEWGNETMMRVAHEWFDANPEERFVLIHEHAGWFLGFRNDESLSTFATANDMAILPPGTIPNYRYPNTIRRKPKENEHGTAD